MLQQLLDALEAYLGDSDNGLENSELFSDD